MFSYIYFPYYIEQCHLSPLSGKHKKIKLDGWNQKQALELRG